MCEKVVALDAKSEAVTKDFRFICPDCYFENFADKPVGGIVNGKLYDDLGQALLAEKARVERN